MSGSLRLQKNIKRRVYKSLDQFVKDMELMFTNAKAFNEDDSQVYKDAVMLQKELRSAATIEKARTDEDLAGGGDGEGAVYNKNLRIPLDKIDHKGDTYRVGKDSLPSPPRPSHRQLTGVQATGSTL